MEHKDWILILLGVAGILLHNLMKIYDLKKKGDAFSFKKYTEMEWPAMTISLVVVIVAAYLKNEIKALEVAGNFIGLGFVTLGYMAQSVLITFMGKASAKAGMKSE